MKNASKYKINYTPAPVSSMDWTTKEYIDTPPTWCSVDLRDGNQSLIVPMSLEEKLEFFTFLVGVGFKEIEVGFPAASETEFEFVRRLIEDGLIPEDVTIQVLTQCREHIIRRTFDSLKGAHSAIVHFYNSTSVFQREQVFKKSKEEIKQIAIEGAQLVKKLASEYEGNFKFEYSPESFTGTEPDYALEVCNAVLDVLEPTENNKVIINLPVTVAMSMSHVYANQVEYMCKNMKYRENVIVSLHPHNDRGCAVADTELGVLAGADRVEGTLFGNGERTGNVDIVTVALNMFSHGVDPGLNFENMPEVVSAYQKATRMRVYERQPYAGALVFAAFSGSHQDAIAKGMKWREEKEMHDWEVPYLPIDPHDVGREYETDVIRINSQSGKGGIGYILEGNFGYDLPPKMREALGYAVKDVSDKTHKELLPAEIFEIFTKKFVNISAPYSAYDVHYVQGEQITANLKLKTVDGEMEISGMGNGRLGSVSNAIKGATGLDFSILTYSEHALKSGSQSEAVAYVGLSWGDGTTTWGAGEHPDIIMASVVALISAINNK